MPKRTFDSLESILINNEIKYNRVNDKHINIINENYSNNNNNSNSNNNSNIDIILILINDLNKKIDKILCIQEEIKNYIKVKQDYDAEIYNSYIN